MEYYTLWLDLVGDDAYDMSLGLSPGRRLSWYRIGEREPLGSTDRALSNGRTVEVRLPAEITGTLDKPVLRLRLIGHKHADGRAQAEEGLLPVDCGIGAGQQLLVTAARGGLSPRASLPAACLAAVREARETAAIVRRVGEMYVLLDDGQISRPIQARKGVAEAAVGSLGFDPKRAIRALLGGCHCTPLRPHPYDFMLLLVNYQIYARDWDPGPWGRTGAYFLDVYSSVNGIGKPHWDTRAGYGSVGRLQGFGAMNAISVYQGYGDRYANETALLRMTHEVGHHWAAFAHVPPDQGRGVAPSGILRMNGVDSHWSCFTQCQGSLMGRSLQDVFDLGNGSFELRAVPGHQRFSDLDLYLMGLLPPEKVAPFFVVRDPDVKEADLKLNQPFHGTRRDVTINDIIAVEGPRIPDWQRSQKDFRAAFVLVTRGETPTAEEIEFVDTLRIEFEKYWHEATRGLSTMDTHLDEPR